MNNYLRLIASAVAISFALSPSMSAALDEVAEEEFLKNAANDPLANAQVLRSRSGGVAVRPARLGDGSGTLKEDVDYYTFKGKKGQSISAWIESDCTAGSGGVDTVMAIYKPDGALLIQIDLERVFDPNVNSWIFVSCNPKLVIPTATGELQNGLPLDGDYTIAVTDQPASFLVGGNYDTRGKTKTANGNYSLVVTGLLSDVTTVKLLIKPHHKHGSMAINLKSPHGKVKVAVLGSDTFNVETIDPGSLTFGAAGTEGSLVGCKKHLKDVNKDGKPDLVCRFNLAYTGLTTGSTTAVLNGKTKDNLGIEGSATVKVIASNKHNDDDDDDDDDEPQVARHR